MDWERVNSTVRELYWKKNGKRVDAHHGRTPLSDLIAKDAVPTFDEMTEAQLCEFAADHHIAIDQGLDRFEIIESIKEALEKNWDERLKAIRGMLDHIFADGPHPLAVIRRVYALAKAVRPQCILEASCAQIAVLCDDGKGPRKTDGRATVSDRIKRLFEEPIKRRGMHGFKSNFQKTESANAAYASSAKNNQNRLGRDFLELKKRKAATA
jgi:glutathionylspermidine synthase